MKPKEEIRSELFETLWELQNTNPNNHVKRFLQIRLGILYDILRDDVEEEWIEQIENEL